MKSHERSLSEHPKVRSQVLRSRDLIKRGNMLWLKACVKVKISLCRGQTASEEGSQALKGLQK